MPDVEAVSASPTCGVPLIVGAPAAAVFVGGAAATASVAALVRRSSWPASSVKSTRTVSLLPSSAATGV